MIARMVHHPVAANLLMLLLIVGGIRAGFSIKQEVFPDVSTDVISVGVAYAGATPEEVEESLCRPIEQAVEGLVGIKKTECSASEGWASARLELVSEKETRRTMDEIKSAVDGITSFPSGAEKPLIRLGRTREPNTYIVVYGEVSENILKGVAEELETALLQTPEITQVDVSGVREREILVEISTEQIRRFQLSREQVSAAIRQATREDPGGKLKTSGGDILIRTKGRRYSANDYANLVILASDVGQVRLKDVATVHEKFEESDVQARFNNMPSAFVEVYRVGNQSAIEVSSALNTVVADFRTRIPDSVKVEVLFDWSSVLQERINLLLKNMWQGLILVLVVLGLFLEIRLAFWILLGIPISFLGAMWFMPFIDVSINMISLFSFILVLGIVVDDAIVIGENIYAHREMGKDPIPAAIEGALEMAKPITFVILTTVAAFSTFFFIPGVVGKFFKVIPYIVMPILAFSLVECLLILPSHLVLKHDAILDTWIAQRLPSLRWLFGGIDRTRHYFSSRLKKLVHGPYRRSLKWSLENRYTTLAFSVTIVLLCVGMTQGGHIRFVFFPQVEDDWLTANLEMPFGTPFHITQKSQEVIIEAAEAVIEEMEEEVERPEVSKGIFSALGWGGSHHASVNVALKGYEERGFSSKEFVRRWKERVGEIPGAESLQFRFEIGGAPGSGIHVELQHPAYHRLRLASEDLEKELAKYPGVFNVSNSASAGKSEIRLRMRPEARSLGMTALGLSQQVNAAFQGLEALSVQRDSEELRVMIRAPLAERKYVKDLEDMVVRLPTGEDIEISRLAQMSVGKTSNDVHRIEGNRVLTIRAKVDPTLGNQEEVVRGMEQDILPRLVQNYPGLQHNFGGEQKEQADTLDRVWQAAIFAVLIIYCLLALQFRSYSQPIIVMVALPFGFVGAVLGHLLMGYNLSIFSFLGMVALAGIVVNDSLVLVDFINNNRLRGADLRDAVIEAGIRRFRPILLTSVTTFFGLLPMVLETSIQAQLLIPMAISLGFGVMFATFVILVLVPSIYLILEDGISLKRKLSTWLLAEAG